MAQQHVEWRLHQLIDMTPLAENTIFVAARSVYWSSIASESTVAAATATTAEAVAASTVGTVTKASLSLVQMKHLAGMTLGLQSMAISVLLLGEFVSRVNKLVAVASLGWFAQTILNPTTLCYLQN